MTHFSHLITLQLVALTVAPIASSHAAPPPLELEGQPVAVRVLPTDAPAPAEPPALEPLVVEGATHYHIRHLRPLGPDHRAPAHQRGRRLPLSLRDWTVVADDGSAALLRGWVGTTPRYRHVSAAGRVSVFTLPASADRFVLCGGRYLVAVVKAGGTLIHDLADRRLVHHDREAGVHERADRYGGPACSPDGRFVAVPDTFAKAVFFFRLSDGARVAALAFDRDGDAPGFVTWAGSPERAVNIRLVPDPIAINPPK